MPGRAIWTGSIRFGDVEVPVKLSPAVKEQQIHFHLLHRGDNVKLIQQMICAREKTPVPADERAKGYELEKGKYILVDPEELEALEPLDSRAIDVHEFVKTGQIDPIFVERTYYLAPAVSSTIFNELAEALRETGVDGICTWTMRKRSYFGMLHVHGKNLRLSVLRHADEVLAVHTPAHQPIFLSEKELDIGSELINQLTASFEPWKFENEHQKKLQHLIAQKAAGGKIAILRPRRLKPTAPDNLLQVLEASLRRTA